MEFSKTKKTIDYYVVKKGFYGVRGKNFTIKGWAYSKGEGFPFPLDAANRLLSEHKADGLIPCEVETMAVSL